MFSRKILCIPGYGKDHAPKLELLYSDGCSSWHQALENLRQAFQSEGVALKVTLLRVVGAQHARSLRFLGCPSIRLAGIDLFPEKPAEYGLTCRLYHTVEGLSGWPTPNMILQRLQAFGAFDTPTPNRSGFKHLERSD